MQFISIYIHIPFCTHRCGYCDFNTFAGLEALIPAYVSAVCNEINFLSVNASYQFYIHTVYFGGGTPSLLPVRYLDDILTSIDNHFHLSKSMEITLETNPGTVDQVYLQQIKSLGVNRLSLGMQTSNQDELELLGRRHSFGDVIHAVEWARTAGIRNINLDLIFGLPNQSMNSWKNNLESGLMLKPEHMSLYALTIEPNTPIYSKIKNGIYPEPDQDISADMYEFASDELAKAGYHHYEISNWARGNQDSELFTCKHNLQYWHNLSYIGLGAGAHGFINKMRTVNFVDPREYISKLNQGAMELNTGFIFPCTPATQQTISIDRNAEIGETMMMGLRLLIEGISKQKFHSRFGVYLHDMFGTQIDRLLTLGLVEWYGQDRDVLRLTRKGRLLGNHVFAEFI
jgi:oxygen-independent coproporphyrinogen-3 oxidase